MDFSGAALPALLSTSIKKCLSIVYILLLKQTNANALSSHMFVSQEGVLCLEHGERICALCDIREGLLRGNRHVIAGKHWWGKFCNYLGPLNATLYVLLERQQER